MSSIFSQKKLFYLRTPWPLSFPESQQQSMNCFISGSLRRKVSRKSTTLNSLFCFRVLTPWTDLPRKLRTFKRHSPLVLFQKMCLVMPWQGLCDWKEGSPDATGWTLSKEDCAQQGVSSLPLHAQIVACSLHSGSEGGSQKQIRESACQFHWIDSASVCR